VADSSAIDNALVGKLIGDPTLAGYLPDGVFFDEAFPGATRFVIVSLVEETDEPMFGGRAYEDALYLVKAVALTSTGANVKAAAARIDALLDMGTLTIVGYSLMSIRRESRVRYPEVDETDPTIRWEHRGGRYRVMASPG
jgi:hypothetical protein